MSEANGGNGGQVTYGRQGYVGTITLNRPEKLNAWTYRMMAELVDWLNQEKEVHPVLVSGISQFQFVHIHPFLDGNGRTSRLLSTLCLFRAGYDFKRLFTISEYYDRDRPAFYRAIQGVREQGMDMTGWLEYFVEGLTEAIITALGRAGDIRVISHQSTRQFRATERTGDSGGT